MTADAPTGVCGACRQPVKYVSTATRGLWVHAETGRAFEGIGDDLHDANTHFIREPGPAPLKPASGRGQRDTFTTTEADAGRYDRFSGEPD